MKMRIFLWAAVVLMALTACKNSVKETAEIIDLPRVETPDSVVKAMEGFFQTAADDSMDIHSVMIVKDGNTATGRAREWIACRMYSTPSVRLLLPLQWASLLPKVRWP